MQAGKWTATADMFESDSFMGIMPLLFGDSPAENEVAFNADPAMARKDVDRMMTIRLRDDERYVRCNHNDEAAKRKNRTSPNNGPIRIFLG